jgi:hypothetical protein
MDTWLELHRLRSAELINEAHAAHVRRERTRGVRVWSR